MKTNGYIHPLSQALHCTSLSCLTKQALPAAWVSPSNGCPLSFAIIGVDLLKKKNFLLSTCPVKLLMLDSNAVVEREIIKFRDEKKKTKNREASAFTWRRFFDPCICSSQPGEKHSLSTRLRLSCKSQSPIRRKEPCEQPMKGRGVVGGVWWGTLGRGRQSEWLPRRH